MKIKKGIMAVLLAAVIVSGVSGSSVETVNAKGVSALETLLNNVQLNPEILSADRSRYAYKPDCGVAYTQGAEVSDEELNAYTNFILSAITTPEMTTYQKVKACYDWIIDHYSYGDWDDCYGYMDCYGYTDAFVYLTRAIGLKSYFAHGETHAAAGGYTNHGWPVIVIDGVEYVFDAEIDDSIAKGGKTRYYRFGKTYAELPNKYILCQPRKVEHEDWAPDGSYYSYSIYIYNNNETVQEEWEKHVIYSYSCGMVTY